MKIKWLPYGGSKPVRQHHDDAGADCFMPYPASIRDGETVAIDLGFGLEIPNGMVGFCFPRSSLAKRGVDCRLPPIDSGYRGSIHAIVTNLSGKSLELKEGERVCQIVILPCVICDFEEDLGEERGSGWAGSTGK